MSTLDLVNAAVPSAVRPHWCRPDGEGVFGILWITKQGDMALRAAVARLDQTAAERNLTRAARNLYMTQPAVSNALGRLRDFLGDKLVVRAGYGVEPTPRALALWPSVAEALRQLESSLAPGAFDPAQAERSFVLAMADATAAGTLGALPGTISLSLANEINVTQASITVPWVSIVRLADAVQVLTVSNQVTNGAGGLSITNGALQQGAWYAVTAWHTDGTKIGAWVKQAT